MPKKILIVEAPSSLETIRNALEADDFEVAIAASADEALRHLAEDPTDLVITDLLPPGMAGPGFLEQVALVSAKTEVIAMIEGDDMRGAVMALRHGAYDYLLKPVEAGRIVSVVRRCLRDGPARFRGVDLDDDSTDAPAPSASALIGSDTKMLEINKMIEAVAEIRAPILLRGEPGTGKAEIARVIHERSSTAAQRFVAVDCENMPSDQVDAAVFGHEADLPAPSGAERRGALETAGHGTLYLTDVTATHPAFQTKLLRVLQSGEFYPLGAEVARRTHARLIATSEEPIERLVREGRFREDLYFRLRVVEISVPPLRERRDDIAVLAAHHLRAVSEDPGSPPVLTEEALETMLAYEWPGNLQELRSVMHRASLLARGREVTPEALGLDSSRPVFASP